MNINVKINNEKMTNTELILLCIIVLQIAIFVIIIKLISKFFDYTKDRLNDLRYLCDENCNLIIKTIKLMSYRNKNSNKSKINNNVERK